VTVLERDRDIASRPQGYAISLNKNGGPWAMERLGLTGTMRSSSRAWCALFFLLLPFPIAACGGDDSTPGTADASQMDAFFEPKGGRDGGTHHDPASGADAAASLDGPTDAGSPRIVIPATTGSALAEAVNLAGSATSVIGNVAITNGVGTVQISGQTVSALVYERQPFGAYTLYQTLAVSPDRIHVLWFYCLTNTLAFVYYEGTGGTAVLEQMATGTCADTNTMESQPVSFPAVDMPIPALVTGYTVTGASIEIPSGAPGWVNRGKTWTVLVFATVDCSMTCGPPGWWELHALLWDPAAPALAYGIFYLEVPGGPVVLDYLSPVLPTLGSSSSPNFIATYTHP
jgi:hypothetical protein